MMQHPLNAQAHFATAPNSIDMSRSKFGRNFDYKSTANAGKLNVAMVDEILPGDTVDLSAVAMARMTTPIFPVMDSCYLETFGFWIPYTQVWDHWREFCGENDSSQWVSTQEYTVPGIDVSKSSYFPGTTTSCRSIGDFSHQIGIPMDVFIGTYCNSLVHRSYRRVWNTWFRDQNLQDPLPENHGDTDSDTTYNALLPVNRVHDYFGSCLPAPQHGDAVRIMLQGAAPVYADDAVTDLTSAQISAFGIGAERFIRPVNASAPASDATLVAKATSGKVYAGTGGSIPSSGNTLTPSNLVVNADASIHSTAPMGSLGIDVAQLRLAVQSQRILERLNFGSRYAEFVRSFFGVSSPDLALQIPELLCYSKQLLNMMDVPQSAPGASGQTPLGTVGAYSKTFDSSPHFNRTFNQHGTIMLLYCIRHERSYSQGLQRMFMRKRFEDYYVPQLACIGDQPVYTREIYAYAPQNDIFGYQEAWQEYRMKPNITAGLLDPAVSGTIGDLWTYTDKYTQAPTLSDSWIQEGDAEIARTLAVTDEDEFVINFRFRYEHTRAMPARSIPGLVDHF